MTTRNPTTTEIQELISFLPKLYAEGFTFVETKNQEGTSNLCYPKYNEVVEQFFRTAAKECWCDYGYQPERAAEMLENHALIASANLKQIKTMLTFCVRGERFCDGFWQGVIKEKHIQRLLQRLEAIAGEDS